MIREMMIDGTAIACRVNDGGFVEGRKGIVFVHGSGGNHTLWDDQCKALQGEFNVAALNLPGHGLSGGAGERDVMRYVQWVKKAIGALGLRGPVLVGHSLGAAISLNFAIHEGYLLSAIVPVGGGLTMPVNPEILEKIHGDLPSVISMVVKFAISKPNREAVGPYLQEGLEQADPDVFRRSLCLQQDGHHTGGRQDRHPGTRGLRGRRQDDAPGPVAVHRRGDPGRKADPHRGRRSLRDEGEADGVQLGVVGICQVTAVTKGTWASRSVLVRECQGG